jgi:Flp pilus assembly pilin Flp
LTGLYVKAMGCWHGLRERLGGERGAVATEYALLLILIALAIIAAATALGTALAGRYSTACTSLGGAGC